MKSLFRAMQFFVSCVLVILNLSVYCGEPCGAYFENFLDGVDCNNSELSFEELKFTDKMQKSSFCDYYNQYAFGLSSEPILLTVEDTIYFADLFYLMDCVKFDLDMKNKEVATDFLLGIAENSSHMSDERSYSNALIPN